MCPIRMHYGHPDMTNAFYMKKTPGVSRGQGRVVAWGGQKGMVAVVLHNSNPILG